MIYAIRPVLLGVLMGMFYIACSYAPTADSQEQRIEASCVPVQFGNAYASGQMCDMPNGDRCYITNHHDVFGGGGLSCIPANNSLRPPDDDGVSSESQGAPLHGGCQEINVRTCKDYIEELIGAPMDEKKPAKPTGLKLEWKK